MNKISLPTELYDLYNLYHEQNYRHCLTEIKTEKAKTNKTSIYYIYLLHLECICRQRINESEPCPIEESISNLHKALDCVIEIQIFEKIQDYPLILLVSMQEKTCILTQLSRFKPVDINELLEIQKFIRKSEYADNQLIYLSYMNEAKIRFELAINHINPKENCKLSLRLSEKSREYYKEEYSDYNITFQNQLDTLTLLCNLEDYGFEVEMKDTLKQLNNKIDKKLSLFSLQIDVELLELGIENIEKLDEIYDAIPIIKNHLYPEENCYQQTIIFEGEILIKKAEHSDDICEKIMYLNQSIEYFNNNLDL